MFKKNDRLIEMVVILIILLVIFSFEGCTTYHRYYSSPTEMYLNNGSVYVRVGQAPYNDSSQNVVVIDSSGISWFVCLEYYPAQENFGCDFNLIIDSTFLIIDEINYQRDISEFQYDGSHCNEFTANLCLPNVRLPSDKYLSKFEMSFVLFVLDSSDDSIIEKRNLNLVMTYQKDKEIYQGR